MPDSFEILISCEHASNMIPKKYQKIIPFNVLESHRGLDIGIKSVALQMAKKLATKSHIAKISRLVVDLNRSPHNKGKLFSEFLRSLTKEEKEELLTKYYFPYREAVEKDICEMISKGKTVVHLSVHSFTPILRGKTRPNDIGLLFDPSRRKEKSFSQKLKDKLKAENPSLKVRFNVPYKGSDDGLTTYLRKRFPQKDYLGIELEMNQKIFLSKSYDAKKIENNFIQAIQAVLKSLQL